MKTLLHNVFRKKCKNIRNDIPFNDIVGNVDLSSGLKAPFVVAFFGSSFFKFEIPRLANGGNDERLRGGRDPLNVVF